MKLLPRSLLFHRAAERLARRVLRHELDILSGEVHRAWKLDLEVKCLRAWMDKNGLEEPPERWVRDWKNQEMVFGGKPLRALLREAGKVVG